MFATDRELPITGGAPKRAYVRRMFKSIAPRYDLLNHLLSLNLDRRWRRVAVDRLAWELAPEGTYLDLCAGTQDLAAELGNRAGFRGRVVAADFVQDMLRRGRAKSSRTVPCGADALALPFGAEAFDGAMVGFGVRNLMDLDAGLREAARILKPGARLVILEFNTPRWQPLRGLYLFYFRRLLPLIGRFVSKHRDAYSWLPASVLAFPGPAELADRLRGAGFANVRYELLIGGICAIHVGCREAGSGKREEGNSLRASPFTLR
ncbi:MAG TPA: ubiquinone/menaquinone biosynthesis methyltransferase [Gemmatimonadales bacterium]|jgi:demethylmenaquinone methyltransferase/2-methoxy-6-polyprenyl-1,4-benzoquinol methylase|nr:ubiquinone/menaquinone biosynthesis methyltransferase [Gemmatimonadales bacterium]